MKFKVFSSLTGEREKKADNITSGSISQGINYFEIDDDELKELRKNKKKAEKLLIDKNINLEMNNWEW